LILHISQKKELSRLVKKVPKKAEMLIDTFWPGPFTVVLEKSDIVPDVITGGLDSVAIRMPDNDIALAIIRESGVPVAAPSANLSGMPSSTSAEHVKQDLYGKIDFIIDGGRTEIGIESTVVDLTVDPPVLLRPGGIIREEIEKIIGKIKVSREKGIAKSPGMKYRHYAPKAKVILVEGKNVDNKMQKLVEKYKHLRVGVMAIDSKQEYKADIVKHVGDSYFSIAKNLFKTFREFDQEGVDIIIVQGVQDKGLGFSIMNRLRKASYDKYEKLQK
jgi:L-threonylcarbamoyladenylate synthase